MGFRTITSFEFSSPVSGIKGITGNEWDPENKNSTMWVDLNISETFEPPCYHEPSFNREAVFSFLFEKTRHSLLKKANDLT